MRGRECARCGIAISNDVKGDCCIECRTSDPWFCKDC